MLGLEQTGPTWNYPREVDLSRGRQIVLRRDALGWNQTELAQAAGVSLSTVLRVEKDRNVQQHNFDAIVGALDREEQKRAAPPKIELDTTTSTVLDSPGNQPSAAPDAPDRASSVTPQDDDVLTEDEREMLDPAEQTVIRRLRRASAAERARIYQVIDVMTGWADDAADDADISPKRFRRG